MKNIGIIGAGSLGTHLSKLICRNRWEHFLTISDKTPEKIENINDSVWIGNNKETIKISDVIFLTVKPDNIKSVCDEINQHSICWNEPKTIISAAAGVPISSIQKWLNEDYNIVRCMPNIPVSNGDGSIVWYSDNLDHENREILDLVTTGPSSVWVDREDLIDNATVAFGCTPAYVAKFFKTYVDIGVELGFTKEESEFMLRDIFRGTLKLLDEYDSNEIIGLVASKGGATEKGLEKLDEDGFTDIIKDSTFSSLRRIGKITKSLD